MQAGPTTVVTIDYTMRLASGEVVEDTSGHRPVRFQFGSGRVVHGLERAILGMKPGDTKQITLNPDEAYGPRRENSVHLLPGERFPRNVALRVGKHFNGRVRGSARVDFWIKEVRYNGVLVDMNHPLAGETLDVQVVVREVETAAPKA